MSEVHMSFSLTYEKLLTDLHMAYIDARRHKRTKAYVRHFEAHAEENLRQLATDLWERTYRPEPATCFIVTEPKRREVFAAQFRDRIVHHLYFNYTHEMLERTFIQDSYSCIKHRGTHYGISRLERHIRRASQNYTEPCWVLKMDISGYFMHIVRQRLLNITLRQLGRMATHRVEKGARMLWKERTDMDFVKYLTREIVLQDPTKDCRRQGSVLDWYGLPRNKSLFYTGKGRGLPIGNLTSQLFSNVYLNELDQYMKRERKCRHYGRYVDDLYVVSADREWLLDLVKPVTEFLKERLGLDVNRDKTMVCDVRMGVEFLGAYLKPRRRYVRNSTVERMRQVLPQLAKVNDPREMRDRVNSMLGILSHYRSYHIARDVFYGFQPAWHFGYYVAGMKKYVLYPKFLPENERRDED